MKPELAKAVSDWRWFFHAAESEMGIRSSFGPMCAILATGCGHIEATAHSDMDDRRLRAARRHWKVEYALMMVDAPTLRLVRLVAEDLPHTFRIGFGEFGNIAHFTEEARAARDLARSRKTVSAWVDRLGVRLASGKATKAEQLAAAQIRDGTERVLDVAAREYHAAKRRVRR